MAIILRLRNPHVGVDILSPLSWLVFLLIAVLTWSFQLTTMFRPLGPMPSPISPGLEDPSGPEMKKFLKAPMEAAECNVSTESYDRPDRHCKTLREALKKLHKERITDIESSKVDLNFDILPVYKAECWTGALYEYHHVLYIHRVCAMAINGLVRGLGPSTPISHTWRVGDHFTNNQYRPFKGEVMDFEEALNKVTEHPVYKNRADAIERYNKITPNKMSFTLLLFGFLLLGPSLLWAIIPTDLVGLNVDRTLRMLQLTQLDEQPSRLLLYQDIARETKAVPSQSVKVAALWVLCKTVTCLVSITELVYIYCWLEPYLLDLSADISLLSYIASGKYVDEFLFHGCDFSKIYHFGGRTQKIPYSAYCIYSRDRFTEVTPNIHGIDDAFTQLSRAEGALSVYICLLNILFIFLILHAALNTLETCLRLAKMCCCSGWRNNGPHLSCGSQVFLDWVHQELGHVTCGELSKHFRSTSSNEDKNLKLDEQNAIVAGPLMDTL